MLRNLLIITCLLSITFLAFGQKKKKKRSKDVAGTEMVADTAAKIDYKMPGAPIPALRMIKEDGKVITNRTVDNNANLFIMMYNPTCEHCQEQAHTFIKNLSSFHKSKILFMASPNMLPYFSYFEAVTKVSKHPEIHVGLDSAGFIDKTFVYQALPQINVYDKDRKLTRVFTGDTPIDSLKQYIQ